MISESCIRDAKILIVDDQEANVVLLEHLLRSAGYNSVSSTMDSREVFDLYREHRHDAILLDLHMPHMDGFQVIEALKPIEAWSYVPVLVVTAEPMHKLKALAMGAKDFISKPFDSTEVLTRVRNLLEVRLLHKELQNDNIQLEDRIRERTADLRESYRETIMVMCAAAEHKDEDTGLHIQRVSHYCRALASLLGMFEDFCDEIFYASPMHDIGKIAIPDHILLKPGGFTQPEWETMKTHTSVGVQILSQGKSPYLKMSAAIAGCHHERWDGSGYPHGLKGSAIPLAARIMNICDIYDALRSKRPYKPAFDHARTMHILQHGDGRTEPAHFEPGIHDAFIRHQETFREIYESNAD